MALKIIPRTQANELDDATLQISRARSLVDVLAEMSASEMAMERLSAVSLYETLLILTDILDAADGFVKAAFDARRNLVADGAAQAA
jgi:hypothetical protein